MATLLGVTSGRGKLSPAAGLSSEPSPNLHERVQAPTSAVHATPSTKLATATGAATATSDLNNSLPAPSCDPAATGAHGADAGQSEP